MFRYWLAWTGTPALAVAALFIAVSPSQARPRVGVGFSPYGGGVYIGFGNGYYPGYGNSYGGSYGGGYYPGYATFGSRDYSYGNRDYSRGYYGYPGSRYDYSQSSYYPGDTENYSYYNSAPSSDYNSYYAPPDTANNSAAPSLDPNAALLRIRVPANAVLWFNGDKTSQTGPVREFASPALRPGREYTYEIRARWNQDGHEVNREQVVTVHAGDHLTVDLLAPPSASERSQAAQPGPRNPNAQLNPPSPSSQELPSRSESPVP